MGQNCLDLFDVKQLKAIILSAALLMAATCYTQVAINTDGTASDNSAILDVKSTDKGMLIPRMTQAQIAAITSPANGLVVFNTTNSRFYFYDDGTGEWKEIAIGTGTITPWVCSDALVDARDSKSYATVQIGTQCWMAENLNIGTRINGSEDQTQNTPTEIIEKYCYDDLEANCDTYGGLYQWDEMMQYTTTQGVQGICMEGWHLPTDAEWCTLEQEVDPTITCSSTGWRGVDGGDKLKETGTTHWASPNTGATNSSGFTALPGGYRYYFTGNFLIMGTHAFVWSSTESSSSYAGRRALSYDESGVNRLNYDKVNGHSVRCIKD